MKRIYVKVTDGKGNFVESSIDDLEDIIREVDDWLEMLEEWGKDGVPKIEFSYKDDANAE